nr:hypothetical protein [Tanacetum cinerariifolium]
MSSLFADTHNVVAILEKSDAAEGFEQIIDFLSGSYIHYALTVNPHIYISCIKQFWNTASVKRSDDITRLQALVDRKKIVISEDVIHKILQLDDAEGVVCLPNEEIFAGLAQMGYEKPSTKLTFYKAFFSSQWKFLIHTLLQSLSAKRTSWNEFGTVMASAVICLSKGQKFNFSKYIFDSLVHNVDSSSKFYMYPRFIQLIIQNQVGDLSTHTTRFISPALTQKVFANMRHVGKEEQVQADDVVAAAVQENVAEDVANVAIPSLPSYDIPSPSQEQSSPPQQPQSSPQAPPQEAGDYQAKRIESSDDMEDVFNQGRMIDDLDKDEEIELVVDQVKDADIAETKGRHAAEKQAEIYHLDLDYPSKVLNAAEGFEQIIDFLSGSYIRYALIVNPHIYISCIKQFWNTASIKRSDDITRLQALIDKKKIVISEDVIREILQLDDAEGVSLSAKRTSWNEFSTAMASAVFCLSKEPSWRFVNPYHQIHFSCFDPQEEEVAEEQVQVDDAVATTVQETVAEDVANEAIPSTPTLLILPSPPSHIPSSPPQQPQSSPQAPPQGAEFSTQIQKVLDVCSALTRRVENLEHDKAAQKLEIIKLKARVKRLERANKVKSSKFRRLKKVRTSQRIESSDDMEDVFNQGRMIDNLDKDEGIELEALDACAALTRQVEHLEHDKVAYDLEIKKLKTRVKKLERANKVKKAEDAQVGGDEQVKGRQDEIYQIDMDHALKVLSMQEDEPEVQEVVEVVTTAKLITEVVATVSESVTAASATIAVVPTATITATLVRVAAASTRGRRKIVVIRDPKEESTTVIPAEIKSKDKGKRIMVEEPKPMKKKQKVEMDEEAIESINESPAQKAAKRRKMNEEVEDLKQHLEIVPDEDDDSREEIEEEDQEVLKSINETPAQKAAKRRKMNEEAQEAEDLKEHLEIVNDEDDDVFTEVTPPGRKNFDREDLEDLWRIVKESFSTSKPSNFSDDYLLSPLKTMFEKPNGQDVVWKNQNSVYGQALRLEVVDDEDDDVFTEATPLARKGIVKERFSTSKPTNFSDEYLLLTLKTMFEKPDGQDAVWKSQRSVHAYSIVKKRYPLSKFILEQLVNVTRLQVEEESEMSLELLRFTRQQLLEYQQG